MSNNMKEWRVTWCQCPTIQHVTRVLFVQAATAEDAKLVAHDHIERKHGIHWFVIEDVREPAKVPPGKVKELPR